MTQYFIKRKLVKEAIDFLDESKVLLTLVREFDPLINCHIVDVLLSIDRVKEAILLLAEQIKDYPYLVTYLVKQSQAFIKCEYYEYALKLAKISVDLCPESFEAWFLLSECYFHVKKIKLSLVALDIAPLYPDIELVNEIPNTAEFDIIRPKDI